MFANKDKNMIWTNHYNSNKIEKYTLTNTIDKLKKLNEQKSLVDHKKFVVVFRIETQSRGGKTVTVLDKLPAHETFVKELTKELKIKTAAITKPITTPFFISPRGKGY